MSDSTQTVKNLLGICPKQSTGDELHTYLLIDDTVFLLTITRNIIYKSRSCLTIFFNSRQNHWTHGFDKEFPVRIRHNNNPDKHRVGKKDSSVNSVCHTIVRRFLATRICLKARLSLSSASRVYTGEQEWIVRHITDPAGGSSLGDYRHLAGFGTARRTPADSRRPAPGGRRRSSASTRPVPRSGHQELFPAAGRYAAGVAAGCSISAVVF